MNYGTVVARLVAAVGSAVSTPARTMTMYDYMPDSVEVPCVFPEGVKVGFDKTMARGTDELTVRLRLLCARTDDREGQHMIYGYLDGAGTGSVKARLEAARGAPGTAALSGACDDLHVTEISEATWIEHEGEKYIGVDFTVYIVGSGTS